MYKKLGSHRSLGTYWVSWLLCSAKVSSVSLSDIFCLPNILIALCLLKIFWSLFFSPGCQYFSGINMDLKQFHLTSPNIHSRWPHIPVAAIINLCFCHSLEAQPRSTIQKASLCHSPWMKQSGPLRYQPWASIFIIPHLDAFFRGIWMIPKRREVGSSTCSDHCLPTKESGH